MRSLLISLLVVLLAAAIQAGVFNKEKVKLGKKNCLCDFNIKIGDTCSGSAKCDKKCSGSGTVELGGCSFTLAVKKGKGKISKCSCEAATVPVPTEPIGPGSGETPVPMTGSGSGETPVPMTGSGSGETPVPIPTSPGSGSGGEGMQCSCKCNCPDGSGECDCDCNCPMTSKAVTCAPGFSAVCPMMGDMCPQDMDPICPHNAISRMGGNAAEGMDKGCQCVPDFLLAMVMIQPTGRMEAVDRAMTKATIQVGKKKCKCSYEMNAENCKKSKIVCDKKCSGKESGVELADGDVMYMVDIAVKKGKVTIAKCDVEAPEPTGTGGGSTGSGSGNGEGGMGGMVSRCACVSKGMGGSGPTVPTLPPTGSGSEPAPPTGSGSEPAPPTGSGSEPAPPTGSGTEPAPPTGSGSGSGGVPWNSGPIETVTRVKFELFTGLTEADEPITFDGENVTVLPETLFDPSKPIKVVIHGWEESSLDSSGEVVNIYDEYPRSFNQLYMANEMDFTILGVHWVPRDGWNEELMSESSTDAANTIGLLIYSLYRNYNIQPSQVHMIGFSMGTVVTSKTAKKVQELGLGLLGRLTLLDPCPMAQASVISRDDATFVEAIHTSSQGICSESPLAHVDYYPNGGDAQPCGTGSCSCPDGSLVCSSCYHGATRCVLGLGFLGIPDWLANHIRAVDLYRESIGRPSAFMSWRCSETYDEFVAGSRSCADGGASELVPMGEHSMDQRTPIDGLYYLKTAGVSPFYE